MLNMDHLTLGNPEHRIKFSVFSKIDEWDEGSLYGSFITSVREIQNYGINKPRELINEKAKLKLGGTIYFEDFECINQPSFVEYLKTGWFINLSVAIDFTASNGELHKLFTNREMNDYETALLEVGNILEPYAYKKKFAGFGFGGIP